MALAPVGADGGSVPTGITTFALGLGAGAVAIVDGGDADMPGDAELSEIGSEGGNGDPAAAHPARMNTPTRNQLTRRILWHLQRGAHEV